MPNYVPPTSVFPPIGDKFCLQTPESHSGPNGHQIMEIRGWIRRIDMDKPWPCGMDGNVPRYEVSCDIELDPEWTGQWGSLYSSSLIRVGNVLLHMGTSGITTDYFAAVSKPMIHVEFMGHIDTDGSPTPQGWNYIEPGLPGISWPWNFRFSSDGQTQLKVDQYIMMVGAVISDDPHWKSDNPFESASQAWGDYKTKYGPNPKQHPDNPSRWTEIHPPDEIQVLSDSHSPQNRMAYCWAVVTTTGPRTLDIDLSPVPSPAGKAHLTTEYNMWINENVDEFDCNTQDGHSHLHIKIHSGTFSWDPGRCSGIVYNYWLSDKDKDKDGKAESKDNKDSKDGKEGKEHSREKMRKEAGETRRSFLNDRVNEQQEKGWFIEETSSEGVHIRDHDMLRKLAELFTNIENRLSNIEDELATKRPFITSEDRPIVGAKNKSSNDKDKTQEQ